MIWGVSLSPDSSRFPQIRNVPSVVFFVVFNSSSSRHRPEQLTFPPLFMLKCELAAHDKVQPY